MGREWGTAEAHFQKALTAHQAMGFLPFVAYTQHHYADMLYRRGEPGDRYHALELLDQSLERAQDIGMVRLERMATELQERLKAQG